MEPIYDELISAWNEGVWTYDRATKKNFKMYVWYQYSMHDFLAYGIFSAWCVHGKFPCPVCKTTLNHAFRQDTKNFMKGVKVTDPEPQKMTGAQVHAQIDALVVNP